MTPRLGMMLPLLLATAAAQSSALSAMALLLAAGTVCTSGCVVKANTAFSFAADHQGANTVGYHAYRDGVLVGDLPVSALQPPGVITFAFPQGLPRGNHQLVIGAYNNLGQEARSSAFPVRSSPNGR